MSRTVPVNAGYTILNGSGSGANGNRIDVWVEYKLGTASVSGNYTPITAYFYAALNSAYTSTTCNAAGLNASFSVNGQPGTGVSGGGYDFTSSAVAQGSGLRQYPAAGHSAPPDEPLE